MPDTTLSPAVALGIDLDAICTRGRYAADPAPTISELRETAGSQIDVLAQTVGVWVGFHSGPETAALRAALLEAFPDCERWVEVGASRRVKTGDTPAILVSPQPRTE